MAIRKLNCIEISLLHLTEKSSRDRCDFGIPDLLGPPAVISVRYKMSYLYLTESSLMGCTE